MSCDFIPALVKFNLKHLKEQIVRDLKTSFRQNVKILMTPLDFKNIISVSPLVIVAYLFIAVSLIIFAAKANKRDIYAEDNNTSAPVAAPAAQEPEFVSNEILIKVKKSVKSRVKEGGAEDTGIASLNAKTKEIKANRIEKIAREGAKSRKDAEIFSWHKITLEGGREILKGKFRPADFLPQPPGQSFNSNERNTDPRFEKLAQAIAKLKSDPNIEAVEPVYIVRTQQTPTPTSEPTASPSASPSTLPSPSSLPSNIPNDPYYASSGSWGQSYADLWGIKKINAEGAWSQSTGSASVVVAVVDTGIDYNHPDIAANIWTNTGEIPGNGIDDDGNGYVDDTRGWNFSVGIGINPFKFTNNNPMDDNGHGSHVAGIIGAVGNNNIGVVGVNWNVKIMPVKILDHFGFGSDYAAARALSYAADNGAKVINNSWGSSLSTSIIEDAIDYAYSKGAILIASAGNSAADVYLFTPAANPKVITVGALDTDDKKADFSNFGTKIDVAAPGVDILSLRSSIPYICNLSISVGSNYCRLSGTSLAAPHVAGLAALILSKHPEFTSEDIRQVLRVSADDVDLPGFDINSGKGRINAAKAMSVNSVLKVQITPSLVGAGNVSSVDINGIAAGQNFVNYELSYSGGNSLDNWVTIATSSSAVVGGKLGTWQTSQLSSGEYTIRLVATDSNGTKYDAYNRFFLEKDLVKGWPVEFPSPGANYVFYIQGATVGDVDGDGTDEIIATTSIGLGNPILKSSIYVIRKNGTYLPGWPIQIGIQPGIASQTYYPMLADLDNDGKKEIVVTNVIDGRHIYIYVLSSSGTILPGWPQLIDSWLYGTTTIGDVTGDNKLEIVVAFYDYLLNQYVLRAYQNNGLEVANLPIKGATLFNNPDPLPILVDVDGDGKQEIISYSSQLKEIQLQKFGSGLVRSWINISNNGNSSLAVSSSGTQFHKKVLAYFQDGNGLLNVWDLATGQPLPNWPKNIPDWVLRLPDTAGGAISFADITSDGQDELILNIYDWKFGWNRVPNRVLIYSLEGNLISDWSGDKIPGFTIPILGDLNNDKRADMFFSYDWSPGLILLDSLGERLTQKNNFGFYLPGLQYDYWGPSFLTDLDHDGVPEIFATGVSPYPFGSNAALILYEYPQGKVSRGALSWRATDHDYQNTRSLSTLDPAADSDSDGFGNALEVYIGTDLLDNCPDDSSDVAYPPDFNNDKKVRGADILAAVKKYGTREKRYDLNANGIVDQADIDIVVSYYYKDCTN